MSKARKKQPRHARSLSDMLSELEQGLGTDKTIYIKDILNIFSSATFGPLIVLPMLLTILPTGTIPFIPAICALLVIFICIQWLFGMTRPWLPQRLTDIQLPEKKLKQGVHQAKPYAKKIDQWISERFTFLLNPISQRLIAAICIILCIGIVIIGGIPGIPAILALPVLFFGTGYMVRDGLVVGLGLLITALSGIIFYYNMP